MQCFVDDNVTDGTLEDVELGNQAMWTGLDATLVIIILCGNTMTIYVLRHCRRLLSLISYQFVFSLAISDLLVGLTLPYHMAFYLCAGLGTSPTSCILRFVFVLLSCTCSIENLILVAIDRYISILYPYQYTRWMTKRVVTGMIIFAWVTALLIATVPTYWNTWDTATECEIDEVLKAEYILWVITPPFILVWVAMFVLYWRIWRVALSHAKRLQALNQLDTTAPHKKSIRVVLAVMGSFSICWLPYFVITCTRVLGLKTPESSLIYKITFSLAMANSCMNPIIYAWINGEFREAVSGTVCCRKTRRLSSALMSNKPSIQLNNPVVTDRGRTDDDFNIHTHI